MKKDTLFTIFSLFTITLLLTSCWTESKFVKRANLDTSKVPADFNPRKHVLLVAEMPRINNLEQTNPSVTRKLDEALKERYPYKYEVVSPDEIFRNSSKYSDTSKYKYALVSNLDIQRHGHTTTTTMSDGKQFSVSPSARTTYIDFQFFDRTKKLAYPPTGNAFPKIEYTVAALVALIDKAKK